MRFFLSKKKKISMRFSKGIRDESAFRWKEKPMKSNVFSQDFILVMA